MPNFVTDNNDLNFPKVDRRAIPPGESETKFIRAEDWNELCQGAEDTRDWLRAATWYGLSPQASDPAPAGISHYVWLKSDGTLWLHAFGVDTDLTAAGGGGGSGTINSGATGKIPKYTASTTLDDTSTASDDGTSFFIPRLALYPNVTTAALPAGTTEDWNPTDIDTVSILRVQTNVAGSALGGIVPPSGSVKDGRILILLNHGDGNPSRGAAPLKLIHRSSGSAAVNRIVMPDLTDLELPYTGAAIMYYEGNGTSSGSWFVLATSQGSRFLRLALGDLWLKGNFPSALSAGNNNDWSPTGWTDHTIHQVLVNTGAVLTGLSYFGSGTANDPYANANYQAGIVRILVNRSGSVAIKVVHDSSASSAANRIYSPVGDFEIPPNGACIFAYDFSSARWRALTGSFGMFSKIGTYAQELDTLSDGNNNDWNPTNLSTVTHRKVVPGSGSSITGITAQQTGHIITLVAFGSMTIKHQDANSLANNRIYLPAAYQAGGLSLSVGDSVTFRYDATFTNWMTIGLAK